MSKNPNKEDKFKNLFESTADEIFYDFLKKHSKKILLLIIGVLVSIMLLTVRYSNNKKLNEEISASIHIVIEKVKLKQNCNQLIDNIIKKTATSKITDLFQLDKNKIAYRSTLLLLKNTSTMNTKEWEQHLKQVNDLPYVCQYIHTIPHGQRYLLTAELLFFKVIQDMKQRNYSEKDILSFFMKKKLHASIIASYMYIYLASQFNDNYMLSDLLSMYKTSIHNIDVVLLTLINTNNNISSNSQINKIKKTGEK
jgi:hypothetical protein